MKTIKNKNAYVLLIVAAALIGWLSLGQPVQRAYAQDAPPEPNADIGESQTDQSQSSGSQADQTQTISKEQLEQLVAPIALYPDPLLTQVLMASTYPLEVVEAARWSQANPKLKGKALENAMQKRSWDASVKSLTAFPSVLAMMNEKLDWTQQLGNAFLAQQQDVLSAVQSLRQRADDAGKLKSTKQQTVARDTSGSQNYITIEPTEPDLVYVPAYDPNVVYGTWPYPDYPPYYWYPPGYIAGPGIWWGSGILAGAVLWGIANWPRSELWINTNRYNRWNRTNITNGRWQHNVVHRRGVPYANRRLNDQFRRPYQGNFSASREQFRGRADAGRAALAGAAGGALAGQALKNRPAQRPAGADRQARPRPTAFDRPAAGQNVRRSSARGRASRTASFNRGGFRGGNFRGVGGFRGGGGGFRGGGGRGGGRRSDIRVKHEVVLLGRLSNGIGFYRFAYNGDTKLYVGVIAQEARKVAPRTVARDPQGYLTVNYDRLGVPFETYQSWLASGGKIPQLDPR
ncbi:DUF3300 domain-containing protein [Hyphomicrobium sp. DY-1]|uniref:DUF3300 domain-containing protein n=1 Tax=Hyphomicrobium sp. DY-1 TaxID=3075650 RepID=UPI0039C31C64